MDDLTPNQNKKQHASLNGNYKLIVRGGNNYIHPTAIIGDDVQLGDDNYIGAFCYITGKTIIGNNNRFEAFCSIGTEPEHNRKLLNDWYGCYYNKKSTATMLWSLRW